MSNCIIPPQGWVCTRGAGHDGPCAALPTTQIFLDLVYKSRDTFDRLAKLGNGNTIAKTMLDEINNKLKLFERD